MSFNSKKMKIAAVSALVLVIATGAIFFFPDKKENRHIFGRNDGIGMDDVNKLKKNIDFEGMNPVSVVFREKTGPQKPEAGIDFSEGRGIMLLKYFRFLQNKFSKSENLATHCADIWRYLISVMPEDDAEKMYAIYRKHLECEIELAKRISGAGQPETLEEILAGMEKIHDFRRSMLGSEMADGLFGAETKTREYALRRGAVVGDPGLSGEEKESLIEQLTSEMWEDSSEKVQSVQGQYNRYRESLEIYRKDMNEMSSDEERSEKVAEIRQKYFTPEVVARLEEVDRNIQSEKETETLYRQQETRITESASLNDDEKKEAVETLQAIFFGNEAEAFRRREAIRLAGEEMQANNHAR